MEQITTMMNNDDIMDIYTIDQVSEVLFANTLPLIRRSLTVGPKKIGLVLAEQTMKIIALCHVDTWKSFCYSGQNQPHKNPFETW